MANKKEVEHPIVYKGKDKVPYFYEYYYYEVDGVKKRYEATSRKRPEDKKETPQNRDEIARKLKNLQHKLANKQYISQLQQRQSETFRNKFVDWFNEFKNGDENLETNTLIRYKERADKWILPYLGAIVLKDVQVTDVKKIFNAMNKAGLSKETQKGVWNLLGPFFKYTYGTLQSPFNPMLWIPAIGDDDREVKSPSTADLYKALKIAKEKKRLQPRFILAIELAIELGLRASEISGLTLENYHPNDMMIYIYRKVIDTTQKGDEMRSCIAKNKMKSRDSRREIELTENAKKAIDQYIAKYPPRQHEDTYHYILTHNGNYLNPKHITDCYRKFCGRLQAKGKISKEMPLGVHKARAHRDTLLADAGADLRMLGNESGHTLRVMEGHYLDKNKVNKRGLAARFTELVKAELEKAKMAEGTE